MFTMLNTLAWFIFITVAAKTNVTTEHCFYWNETGEDSLSWSASMPTEASISCKSASQFFGGLTQDSLMDGSVGKGVMMGVATIFAGVDDCRHQLHTTYILVCLCVHATSSPH